MRFKQWHVWVVAVLLLHGLMLAYDSSHPQPYWNADRAGERWQTLQGVLAAWQSGGLGAFLAAHGNAGDYLPQALLYMAGGRALQIAVQVGLTLLSGWAVMRMALILGLTENRAGIAACVYLLLPHTLVFPHQLASEAMYVPLLVISLWLVAYALAGRSGLVLGLANLVRPVTLLWPPVVSAVLALSGRWRASVTQLLLAVLPVLVWICFIQFQTGHFGMGESSHDMGHNLYQRASRITDTLGSEQQAQIRQVYLNQGDTGTLNVGQYLRFAAQYPGPFVQHTVRDLSVFCCKSGVERISIDYLEAGGVERRDLQQGSKGWRTYLEQHGLWATLQFLWQGFGMLLLVSLLGAVAMIAFTCTTVAGIWLLFRRRHTLNAQQRMLALLLSALPLYVLVISQLVDAMQSRHRAPAEAAMVLLTAYALSCWRRPAVAA